MPDIEERVESLETLLGRFILHTDMSLNRLSREVDRVSKEVDRVSKEVDRLSQEMREFKDEMRAFRVEMNKRWGEITNKLGTFAEDMVAPNTKGIAKKYFGCEDFEDFMVRRTKRHSKDKTKKREFDVIAVCDELVIVNEAKSTARINYIDEFIGVLQEFYDYFPEYRDKRLIPVFASLYLGDDVVNYLTRHKIYAMAIKEDTMDLLNFEVLSK
ncbi:MAG: hypothetical protein ACK415_02970 [Thermodesulfovibrionales bacterium]